MNIGQETLWCDGCGIELLESNSDASGKAYCCDDCRTGWGCACWESLAWEDGRQTVKDQAGVAVISPLAPVW